MTKDLMDYICWCNSVKKDIPEIDELPNDYIDSKLRETLTYKDGIWRIKK